jgi:chromosome segregation ATPase
MMTGRETLGSIERAIREVSDRVDRLNAEVEAINRQKAELLRERLAAFEALARHRTETALADEIIDSTDQLSAHVRTILEARQKTLKALKNRSARAQKARAALLEAQTALDDRIETLEQRLDTIGEQARQALGSEPDYEARAERHEELRGMVAKAAEKARRSRAEENEKGAPYRDDPLFMYLWRRGYGTADYDKSRLIRMLDDWVARLIRYDDARRNFSVLTQIPDRLEQHVARLRELLDAERAALDAMEADKIEALAGADLLEDLRAAHSRRDEQTAELQRINGELSETGEQIKTYAEGRDPSFREAIETSTEFLQRQNLPTLLREARATPDAGDDELVGAIRHLEDNLGELEDRAKDKREELDAAFSRKQELLRLAAEFRRARYDAPGSVFEPSAGGEKLAEMLLQGAITAAEYWARAQRNHRWRGRPADGYRRTSGWPMGRPPNRREQPSGPDFRTGGGF